MNDLPWNWPRAARITGCAVRIRPEHIDARIRAPVTSYKRPNQLLHDPERLVRLLTNPDRPVQLVIAGKAHPDDKPGQTMVRAWVRFVQRPDVRRHAVFLSDYDLSLAERLVQGADLWLNTPRRPWEACGTSGMKVLVNGGLNLSELDGWWAEAYSPEVGWALGDGNEHGEDLAWDEAEADALYEILEQHVTPTFYTRDHNGIPNKWVSKMRESMARLTPQFSANRAVREYADNYYVALATAYRERARDRGAPVQALLAWKTALLQHWADVRFGELQIKTSARTHLFQVQVYLGDLSPEQVRVELYAESLDGALPIRHEMTKENPLPGSAKAFHIARKSRILFAYRLHAASHSVASRRTYSFGRLPHSVVPLSRRETISRDQKKIKASVVPSSFWSITSNALSSA